MSEDEKREDMRAPLNERAPINEIVKRYCPVLGSYAAILVMREPERCRYVCLSCRSVGCEYEKLCGSSPIWRGE